jgi:type I restriction enzyme R subunit
MNAASRLNVDTSPSPNFAFLAHHDARLVALATQAEQQFANDPNVTLYKLRQFSEILAKRAAAKVGLLLDPREELRRVIDALWERSAIGATQRDLFHQLRRTGNDAVHDLKGTQSEALHQLKVAHQLAIWFQRTFGNDRRFDPGPFIPPSEPKKVEAAVHEELKRLRDDVAARAEELKAAREFIEEAKRVADAELAKRLTAEQLAANAKEDVAIWEALAQEHVATQTSKAREDTERSEALERQNHKLLAELAALQATATTTPAKQIDATVSRAAEASEAIHLDEAATRKLIDQQLRNVGWEVDSETLTFERGVRPTKGKNLAIAEWPTLAKGKEGRADYVLFAGLQVVGVVEAKRRHTDVPSVIEQAKRYSEGYLIKADEHLCEGSPWGVMRVPFLFATNGRPFLRQLRTKSGIWFLDARRSQNHPVHLEGWYRAESLLDLLKQDVDTAMAKLKEAPMPYIDREYQRDAIRAVETAIEHGQRDILLAMATGTGKTVTAIGLCYRLLSSQRFRRILFLVDRNALGQQAAAKLKEVRLEKLQTLPQIFGVKELGDLRPERDTRLQIATVQAMVHRIYGSDSEAEGLPPVDEYDCILVDECHRGYVLDRELSDREFEFRDQEDYVSKYRRVLDHFDAVKIGLTATPALHTKELFGSPVYSYSYREAVVDGFLVDHEPPVRIITKLAHDGIHYDAQEEVLVLNRETQTIQKEELADEVQFDVENFNKNVITENFNRTVLKEVVRHIDPAQEEKTLVFCATDEHADLVVVLLKELLDERYEGVDDKAVKKITGKTDNPSDAILHYRNERQPNIAVTVDLLTTGIDIPKIANLVFLRRVRSRILYEQMLGRATRLCPEIGKERFRIFDAVDLYAALQDVTDMKPVVVNPAVAFEALGLEILSDGDEAHRRESVDEFIAKLQRKKRFLKGDAGEKFETAAGMSASELTRYLKEASLDVVASFFRSHASLCALLDRTTGVGGYKQIVSEHHDELREVTTGYGKNQSRPPADYLESFKAFITNNLNTLPALLVVTQRPRELTRGDLKKLKLALDDAGFNENQIRSAWQASRNEDVAATIVGYIRQLAVGSPLIPYAERVDHAVQRLRKTHSFTNPQLKWLDRIIKQIKLETVVDHAAFESGQFKADGGFARLNKVFDGKLDALLTELSDEVWKDAG